MPRPQRGAAGELRSAKGKGIANPGAGGSESALDLHLDLDLHPDRDRGRRVSSAAPKGRLAARIFALGVVVVLVQVGVAAEVPIFGVNVELTPLLVAFIGLLCGSMTGALAGFGIGLLVDLSLVQTLGITSLLFTLIGFSAGRVREARDPQAALTPLLIGAAAAAAALIGYSVIEFLLGVEAPVSVELLRQIVLGVVVDTIVALPFWVVVRWAIEGGMPEEPPGRRRRRSYSTGGLSPLSRV